MTTVTYNPIKGFLLSLPFVFNLQNSNSMEPMPENTSNQNWWGCEVEGPISKSAVEPNGIVRLRFETGTALKGEVRSPTTYLFCPKHHEEAILNAMTLITNNLFLNGKASSRKKSPFDMTTFSPHNFKASVNMICFEEFTKSTLFEPKFEFNYEEDVLPSLKIQVHNALKNNYTHVKEDLFPPVNAMINLIRKNLDTLEHVIMEDCDKHHPKNRWKFPKELSVLMGGNPYNIWAVSVECRWEESFEGTEGDYWTQPKIDFDYKYRTETGKNKFIKLFDEFEKYHYKTKANPDKYKLALADSGHCTSTLFGKNIPDPYFSIICYEKSSEIIYMNFYVHPQY